MPEKPTSEPVYVITWNNGASAALFTAQELADWCVTDSGLTEVDIIQKWVLADDGWTLA
jgi:hypothetical protein